MSMFDRVYQNSLGGELTVLLPADGTVMESNALPGMQEIIAPQTMTVILDPDGVYGSPEIVTVTDHAAFAYTAVVARGQEGTVARQHRVGVEWVHGPTAKDADFFLRGVPPLLQVESIAAVDYTVLAQDHGKVKRFTDPAQVTVNLPSGLPIGTIIQLLFVGTAGGVIQSDGTSTVNGGGIVPQHVEASCLVSDTDTWNVQGAVMAQ